MKTITIHMPARYAQYWGIRDTRCPPRHPPWWVNRVALFASIVWRWWERPESLLYLPDDPDARAGSPGIRCGLRWSWDVASAVHSRPS